MGAELMVGMEPESVVIRPYDPQWPTEFERVRLELADALPESVLGIEHVGSTSVPGLDAKPIIDILVGVPDLTRGLELVPVLESLGFEYRAADDLPDRHYFPRTVAGLRVHHLSIAEPGSRHFRNTIAFRDALRADGDLARRYADLKYRVAKEVGHVRFAYTNGKTDFILSVLRQVGGEVGGDYRVRDLGSGTS
ncbi:MAG TPA: GrpB family protein [Actinomycetota bacterium]|nr:GrpB family protein [Actinomycetota bacterium]